MGRKCDICGKQTMFGNNVSHSHKKTKRTWKINLINMKALIDGKSKKVRVCSRCLRSGKVQKVV